MKKQKYFRTYNVTDLKDLLYKSAKLYKRKTAFVLKNEGKINYYCDYSLSVSADTAHPREAMLYLDFLASEEAAEIYVKNTGSFSGFIGAPVPDNTIAKDIQTYVDAGKYIDNPSDGWPPYFYINAERILAEYMFGGRDYDNMTKALDSAWNLRTEEP